MYHPWITHYCEEMNDKQGEGDFLWTEGYVLSEVKESLRNHTNIMSITWVVMLKVLGGSMCFSDVYRYGWDRNEDTKVLRKKFEEMAFPKVLNKSLEDYL